jgi:hypothetical protein
MKYSNRYDLFIICSFYECYTMESQELRENIFYEKKYKFFRITDSVQLL